MRIAVTGASGFVGSALCQFLTLQGADVVTIGRREDTQGVQALAKALEGCDAVINLAGAPIIARWSESYKHILRTSRIDTTKRLVEAMGYAGVGTLVSTSAVGIYHVGMEHDETNCTFSDDFLGSLCQAWEAQAQKASQGGARVVIARFGIVLGRGGGALAKMIPLFRWGLGGVIGSGQQGVSWIHIDDLVSILYKMATTPSMTGAYNLCAPHPTTNGGLTKALAHALHRPAFLPVPEFALRWIYSEGAKVLTDGQKVYPRRLLDEGVVFQYQTIDEAVEASI